MEAPAPVGDEMFSPEDLHILKAFARSRLWQRLRDALCHRREALFNEEPSDTSHLWMNRGAIKEVNWLLHNTPKLMLQYERWRRSAQAGKAAENVGSATETAGLPHGPATFEG